MPVYHLPPSLSLSGKVALVTGASKNIGRAIAQELFNRGASVALMHSKSADKDAMTQQIAEMKLQSRSDGYESAGSLTAIHRDLASHDGFESAALQVLESFSAKSIDILVHSAGYMYMGPTEDMTPERYTAIFDTQTRAAFFLGQACVAHMPAGGRIILIGSSSARLGSKQSPHATYGASKAALEGLAIQWAYEYGPKGITANVVSPGLTLSAKFETPEWRDKIAPVKESYATRVPGNRTGTPDDTAQVVAFIASEGSRWITGQTIEANGGGVVV